MFAIIIVVVAVALTIIASIITLQYINSDGNSAKSEAARIFNEVAQIKTALLVARNEGMLIQNGMDLNQIAPKYMLEIPRGADFWVVKNGFVAAKNVSDPICVNANLSMGFEFSPTDDGVRQADGMEQAIPYCSKSGLDANVPCCDTTIP